MKEMRNCPYCDREREFKIQPHYTKHKLGTGMETWIAYCPACGARTPYTKGLRPKTLEQAKESWNQYHLIGTVDPADVPMQTFSPD